MANAVLLTVALTLTWGTPAADDAFVGAKRQYAALRANKTKRAQRIYYENLIRSLLAASKQRSARADDCAYFAATIAEDLHAASGVAQDLDQAVELNVEVANRFSRSSLADDALLRAARLLVSRRSDLDGARELLQRARREQPRGDQAAAVAELLSRLPKAASPPAPSPVQAAKEPSDEDRVQDILDRYVATLEDAGVVEDAPSGAVAAAQETEPSSAAGSAPVPDGPPRALRGVKTRAQQTVTQVTIQTAGPVQARAGTVPATAKLPYRYYVDLTPALLGHAGRGLRSVKDARIQGVRAAQYDANTVRVVFDLTSRLPGTATYDVKAGAVVVQLGQPTPPPPSAAVAVAPAPVSAPAPDAVAGLRPATPAPEAPAAAAGTPGSVMVMDGGAALKLADAMPDAGPTLKDVKELAHDLKASAGISLSAQAGLKVKRVVIDAGHGGHDPGAIGRSGAREKDITLRIARKVAQRLRKELGMQVILTRDKDVYLPLEQRTAIANAAHADLFISIHCNSSPNRRIHGVETYHLNITDDKYAIRLAARENRDSEKSIGDLEFILADLAMKSNVDDSARLSRLVQGNVVGELREHYPNIKDLGVKHALFYVLIGAKMPAILVETSFLSNKTEEKRLVSSKYQERLADGVVQGVRSFVEERQALAR